MKPKVLNLGCGARPYEGAVNLDIADIPGVDVVHDLDIAQWPFADCSFDQVAAFDVFEHVDKPLLFMAEAHRVLVEHGLLWIHTNYWRSMGSYRDPTHKRFCTEETFNYWVPGSNMWERFGAAYGGHAHPFELKSVKLDGGTDLDFVLVKLLPLCLPPLTRLKASSRKQGRSP